VGAGGVAAARQDRSTGGIVRWPLGCTGEDRERVLDRESTRGFDLSLTSEEPSRSIGR